MVASLGSQPVGSIGNPRLHGLRSAARTVVSQEAVELLGPDVLHVHACDAVRDLAGRGNEVELGRGTADFPELLGRLTEFDYRGWITIERRDSANPIAEIENAVAYLRAL